MAASNSLPFTIPKAIHRSKTAILKALSSTVGVDKTAPHFAFIDDPTTIPNTPRERRDYFLAREFGRRAARQLAMEWPTLFMFDRDKPRLEAFRPEKLASLAEAEDVDENSLRRLVDAKEVSAALIVFERLRANETKLSPEIITDLFRLVCYFNAQDPPPSENEEWAGIRNFYSDPTPDSAKSADLVALLYSMVEQNISNYSVMISWLCKFGNEDSKKRAQEMFKESVEKKWVLDEDAYIGLISQLSDVEEITKTLEIISKLKVKPSIRLFNAAIESLSKVDDFDKAWNAIQSCLDEAARLGLEPNLTTYDLVLSVLKAGHKIPTRRSLEVNCLAEILERLESQPSILIQQPSDARFFTAAMVAARNSNNEGLLDRVEQLYSSKKNQVKMMGFSPEAVFYGQYLTKKIHGAKNIDDIQKLYMELVPRVVAITPELIELMVVKLKGSKNWALTKRVIEDGLCARFLMNEEMLQKFLRLLADIQPENELSTVVEQSEYAKLISKIVDYLLEFANFEETETFLHRKLTPGTISNCAVLLLRSNQAQKAWTLINMLVNLEEFKHQIDSKNEPYRQDLLEVFKFALSSDDAENAANCLELISRYNPKFNITPYINEVVSTFQLGTTQKQNLFNFVKKIGSD